MSDPAQPDRKAWQPVTPSGVARFAAASFNRLLSVQIVVAAIVAASVLWFLSACYVPVLVAAMQELPDKAEISQNRVHGVEPSVLAENKFLSLGIESGESSAGGIGDLQIRLGPVGMRMCSLVGCLEIRYPEGRIVPLSRTTLEPAWGAWKPIILGGIGFFLVVLLMICWFVLALLYTCIPKLVAFYADRQLSWTGSWKLASAAQLPGALFVVFSIVVYGLGAVDLIRFLVFYALHLPISWTFLFLAPVLLPKIEKGLPAPNPFTGTPSDEGK